MSLAQRYERECFDCHHYWRGRVISNSNIDLPQCPACGSYNVMDYETAKQTP